MARLPWPSAATLCLTLLSCNEIFPYASPHKDDAARDGARDVATDAGPDRAVEGRADARDGSGARDGLRDAPRKELKGTSDTAKNEGAAMIDLRRDTPGALEDGAGCLSSWALWTPSTPCGGYLQCCFSCSSTQTLTIKCDPAGTCTCDDGAKTRPCNGFPSCQAAWSASCCKGL